MTSKTVFVTGASGFIGSALVRLASNQGYQVRGLSRSVKSDAIIKANGGQPVRGDLESFDVLSQEASNADIVCYLASAFTASSTVTYEESMNLNMAAVNAIASAMVGSNKALVVSSTAVITKADPDGNETTENSPNDPSPFFDHTTPSLNALKWASQGVRVSVIRLAPLIYGPGEQLVGIFGSLAAAIGGVPIVDEGATRTSTVHVNDAARLYLLAAEKGIAGECYNAASETTSTLKEISTVVAHAIGAPTKHLSRPEATSQLGPMLTAYLSLSCRASSEKARRLLGWEPQELGILEYYKGLEMPARDSVTGTEGLDDSKQGA